MATPPYYLLVLLVEAPEAAEEVKLAEQSATTPPNMTPPVKTARIAC